VDRVLFSDSATFAFQVCLLSKPASSTRESEGAEELTRCTLSLPVFDAFL
jgi:hypothetical protein